MSTVDVAINWVPHAIGNDWGIFAPVEGETEHEAAIRVQASLLAHRIDRQAPAQMIDSAASGLAGLIRPKAGPAFNYA